MLLISVIVVLILLVCIIIYYNLCKINNDIKNLDKPLSMYKKLPKILYLIIYNENTDYEKKMKEVLDKYINNFCHITAYYITFKKLDKKYEINGNIIYFDGTETSVPGILDKTIRGIKLLANNYEYDYMIRSNISTVVNFIKLTHLLANIKETNIYGTDKFIVSLHFCRGLACDTKDIYIQFASGTCIILDKISLEYLLNNINKLRYDIIDDVAIGLLMKSNNDIKYYEFPGFSSNSTNNNFEHIIFYRNKTGNRYNDIKTMNNFINYLTSKTNSDNFNAYNLR